MTTSSPTPSADEAARSLIAVRELPYPPAEVFAAFSDPERLPRWWGPKGFRNTVEEIDLRPGGIWRYVMHGPDRGHYRNESRFVEIDPPHRFVLDHICLPLFRLVVTLSPTDAGTRLTWTQIFEDEATCANVRQIVEGANEENLDRLEAELER